MSRHIDKAELISKLQTLEGLSNDERSSLIGLLREHKKYGLVWEDKPEDVEERLCEELPVLREVKDKAILSSKPDAPNHILIEGDNLEALTALSYTHEGKIDVIYIDPPYNTGNKDFVYNDSFVDTEDSYRHSKWLSFMNKRLKIAKKLLSDKGVIFISIDDNEQAQLKIMCDELFGNHFMGTLVWFKKRKGSFLSNKMISLTEYVHIYGKDSSIELFGGKPDNNESQPIIKRTNSLKVLHFEANVVKSKLPNGIYPLGVYGEGTSASELLNDVEIRDGAVVSSFDIKAPFVWSQEYLDEEIKKGTEILMNTKNFQVRVIRHNNESIKALPSFIDGRESNATNEDAYELLKSIFAIDRPFQYSKPVNFIKTLLNANSYFNKNVIILDFFAGSGTTLHATMQLNAEDGGHRQCILVTNNENNICEEVTYERNKRVINGYTTPKGVQVAGLKQNTLRYYKTDYISRDRTQRNMRELVAAATDLLCIKEDLYEEQPTFGRFRLKPQLARYFRNDKRHMLIIYREELIDEIAAEIKTLDFGGKRLKIYVFSPGRYAFNDNFREVEDKVELVALPAAIYDAYQKVLPKRREKLLEAEDKHEINIPKDLFAEQEEGGEA
ncbi:MAG: site-specific DNA-methyltransferase [Prevotella sp.]|nr:site-specific DNA-methyltransferase [Prevotella sp.]